MNPYPRRPKLPSLAALYDAGVQAAANGGTDPYDPPHRAGDRTRSVLWSYGYQDEADNLVIATLV